MLPVRKDIMSTLYERCQKVMSGVSGRATKLGVVDSDGAYLYTEDGRKVLDFASGVAVNNIGAKNEEVVDAIKAELDHMIHVGHNVVYYKSYVELAEKLVEKTGGDTKVYFSNSGAEANEGAIKLAKYYTKRPGIIAFKNSFHGRTIGLYQEFTGLITAMHIIIRKDLKVKTESLNALLSLMRYLKSL